MKSLIVEDDLVSRTLLQRILVAGGQCDVAVDGLEALVAFKEAISAGQPYDLVCLDIVMPKMDGLATLMALRQFEETHGVDEDEGAKVVMISSLEEFVHGTEAFCHGSNGYLDKPIDEDALAQELERLGLIAPESTPTD